MAIFKSLISKPKFLIIATLFLAIVILGTIQLFSRSKSQPNPSPAVFSPQPSPAADHFILPSPTSSKDPQGKGDPTYYEEINRLQAKNYPLKNVLPYKNNQFSIKYTAPLTLQVIVLSATSSAQTQVEAWIKTKGVDPATHKIFYQ